MYRSVVRIFERLSILGIINIGLLMLMFNDPPQWATGGGLGWFEFHYFKSCLMWHFVQILGKVELPLLRNRSSALKKGLFNF